MKSLLIILSSLTIATSGILAAVQTETENKTKEVQKTNFNLSTIDWNSVKNNFTLKDSNSYRQFERSIDSISNSEEMLKKAQEKSLEFIDSIKDKNLTFDQFLQEVNKKAQDFDKKDNYKTPSNINVTSEFNSILSSKNNYFYSTFSSNQKIDDLNDAKEALAKFDKDLMIAQNTLSTLAVIAGVAAAGFWAAAWWFGISIPWAIAATAISASLGVAAAGIGFYRHKTNLDPGILSSASWAWNIWTIASSFKEIVYPV